jgi:hypothetical protein
LTPELGRKGFCTNAEAAAAVVEAAAGAGSVRAGGGGGGGGGGSVEASSSLSSTMRPRLGEEKMTGTNTPYNISTRQKPNQRASQKTTQHL